MLSEDRKSEGLAPALSIADNLTITNLAPFGPAGTVCAGAPAPRRGALDRARWRSAAPGPAQAGRGAVGRQPAEGRDRAPALSRRGRARARRADPRHRRLQQGADLRADRRAGRLSARQPPPKAVLLVSSYLPELLGVCDRVAVMFRGRLQPARPVAELTESRPDGGDDDRRSGPGMTARALLDRTGALIGLLLVALVFTALAGTQFFAPGNLELMARQTAIVCMAALGMTAVIVAGGIDLSVGSVIALTTVVIARAAARRRVRRSSPRLAGVGGRRRLRAGQRPAHHPPPRRPLHRHAGDDADRARRGEGRRRTSAASRRRSRG